MGRPLPPATRYRRRAWRSGPSTCCRDEVIAEYLPAQLSEAEIADAQRWAARHLRSVVEPGGAVALAAILSRRVAVEPGTLVLVSGGNVDPAAYGKVIAA